MVDRAKEKEKIIDQWVAMKKALRDFSAELRVGDNVDKMDLSRWPNLGTLRVLQRTIDLAIQRIADAQTVLMNTEDDFEWRNATPAEMATHEAICVICGLGVGEMRVFHRFPDDPTVELEHAIAHHDCASKLGPGWGGCGCGG